ncbi:MAG: hypothetical protein RLZ04_1253 [Actinomycetota bacterium]|jgi:DMSO/TMAO reductase YedYZ heme-binding membrane subunit
MSSWWWYLTRSTGIVAAVLSVAALMWGFYFSSRNMGQRLKANWWLALHNWLGGSALAFTAVHMLVSFLDTEVGLRFVDLLWPNGEVGWEIGWGVIAFWLFCIVVLSSVARIRRRLPRSVWHAVHLLAIPAVVLMAVHSLQAGYDADTRVFTRIFALIVGIGMYPLSVRVLSVLHARRTASA